MIWVLYILGGFIVVLVLVIPFLIFWLLKDASQHEGEKEFTYYERQP